MCDLKLQEYSWLVFLSIAGTSSNTLKIDDLCDELSTVSDWYQLGLKLGVPDDKLDEIQRNHPLHQRKREALNLWLQLKHDASWMSIERVLQRMGEKTLAKRIRQTYLRRGSSKPLYMQFDKSTRPCIFGIVVCSWGIACPAQKAEWDIGFGLCRFLCTVLITSQLNLQTEVTNKFS